MQDENQTTTETSEAENSGSLETTTTETEKSGSSSSPTTEDKDSIDLGKAPKDDAADGDDKPKEGEGDADGDDDKSKEGEDAAELFGAPEEGAAYELTGLPEGTVIDEEALKAIDPVARELNLSSAGLSRMVGVYAEKVLPRVAEQVVNGINTDVTAQRTAWETEARDMIAGKGEAPKNAAGETLAFDGLTTEKVMQTSAKALDRLAPEGFREWLHETGLGVHPMMVTLAYNAGKLLAEDTEIETADKGGSKGKSAATTKIGGMHTDRFFDRG